MNDDITVLIACEEKQDIFSVKKIFEKYFDDLGIIFAYSSYEAINLAEEHSPDIIIFSYDLAGTDGIELIEEFKEKSGDDTNLIAVFKSYSSSKIDNAIKAGITSFVLKPFDSLWLKNAVRNCIEKISLASDLKESNELINELAVTLENDVQDLTRLSVKIIHSRIPYAFDMLKRVAAASVWIANQLEEFGDEEVRDIEIAAFLSLTGKLFLPDNLIRKPVLKDGQPSDPLMYQVPVKAREIASSVRHFKNLANILYHIFENFDGSGFPDRKQSWQIPFESRIIRVALDYEEYRENTDLRPLEILEIIKKESKRLYDQRPVILLENYIKNVTKEEYDPTERAVQLQDLVEGMVLKRDIITNSGLKMLPGGAVLKEKTINQIISINSSDPVLGDIYVQK